MAKIIIRCGKCGAEIPFPGADISGLPSSLVCPSCGNVEPMYAFAAAIAQQARFDTNDLQLGIYVALSSIVSHLRFSDDAAG